MGTSGGDMCAASCNAVNIVFNNLDEKLEFVVFLLNGALSGRTLDTDGWIDNVTTLSVWKISPSWAVTNG